MTTTSEEVEQLFANFGAAPFHPNLVAATAYEANRADVNGQAQPSGFIQDGVVDMAQFASGIIPPRVVTSLPTLPDTTYPEGSTVYLTTDGKLYRTDGSTWTAAVGSVDGGIEIVGSLPTLPDAAYPQGVLVFLTTDEKLYRNTDGSTWSKAVDGADIEAGTIVANAIAAGTITGAKIASTTITASNIAAGTITGAKIATDTITAGQIAAAAIGASEIAANAVQATHLLVGMPGNLVTNPGFETGDFTGWQANAATGGAVTVVTTNPMTGKYHAQITNGGTANGNILSAGVIPVSKQSLNVVVGAEAVLSGNFIIRLKCYTAALGALADVDSSVFNVGAAGWVHVSYQFTLPATTQYVQIQFINQSANTTMWIDDIEMMVGGAILDSDGIIVYNGKITVKNPGSTVIIDGTSNMFKILATGTCTATWPAGANANASGTATIGGSGSSVLATIWMMTPSGSAGTPRLIPPYIFPNTSGVVLGIASCWTDISGGANRVTLNVANYPSSAFSGQVATGRYYLLKEASV